jgi:sigma-B regulation protein RsbU (phosphoserine phosphatase)
MFVTAFMGFYNIPSGSFRYVDAGHNPPLIRKHDGSYNFLETEPGYVLGWMNNAQYNEKEVKLETGDVLYLYTDGVTEAMNGKKELFGEQRLVAALNANRDCEPEALLTAIKREVDNFAQGTEQADDITMLALKINNKAGAEKKLEIKAILENLNTVLDFVNTELENKGCDKEIQGKIEIAVEEIFLNIANYAYSPDSGDTAIFLSVADKITIRFEDTGMPYNPLDKAEPDLDKPLMERDIGGLGVFLVRKLMDNIEYTRVGNKNVLVMTKGIRVES